MINDLFQLAGKHKPQFIQGTVLYVISSLFAATLNFFLYLIVKELFENSIDIQKAVQFFIGIALCMLLQGVFLYWANSLTQIASSRMIGDLRLRLGNHIRKLPMGFFKTNQVGDLNGLVSDDIKHIEPILSLVYPRTVGAIAIPIFIAAFLVFIDWRLTLATLSGVPIAILIYANSQKLLKNLTQLQKRSLVEANSRTIEYIQGMATIKSFNQTGSRFQKLEKALDGYKKANLDMVTQLVTPSIVFSLVLELGFVVILFVGLYILFGGKLTVPIFLLFLILGLRVYEPLFSLFQFSAQTRIMDAALARVLNVLNTPSLPEPDREQQLKSFDIEFKNVSFSYENAPVLKDISFKVPERSVTALVGPSGSGKTTITNLVARFWDVNSGEIFIGGVNIKDMKTDELLSNISMVFQDVYLFNDSILNNIKFGKSDATFEETIRVSQSRLNAMSLL